MEHPRPHVICIPFPAQGHINPMLKLAKLLHFKGFHVTLVHTEFNYKRLVNSRGEDSFKGLEDFRFECIIDGLPPCNTRGILDQPSLCITLPIDGLRSFRELVMKLNSSSNVPPVTCIVSDGIMSFTLEVAREFSIPEMVLFTPSGCGMLGYLHFQELINRGFFPLKDESCLTNGYLDTPIDWIPELHGIRLRDMPTFIRSTNINDILFNYNLESVRNASKAKGLILNTYSDLEHGVLDAIKTSFPNLYTIGPLSLLYQQVGSSNLSNVGANLWKEDDKCIEWLDNRDPKTVLYVNFGSIVIMTHDQLNEFAWGLANSKCYFIWIIRPDLVDGGAKVITNEYMREISNRGLVLEWCHQEKILSHASIGGFLTHCGWNSTLESICGGVPLICWPLFAEQQMNCFYSCSKWKIGLEIDSDVRRDKVERLVREVMEGEKGKEMRNMAMEWKKKAEVATTLGGKSYNNFQRLVQDLQKLDD